MGMTVPTVVKLYTDSAQAVSYAKGTCVKTKLGGVFDKKWGWVQELADAKQVVLEHVPSHRQLADLFTKCLTAAHFKRAVGAIQERG